MNAPVESGITPIEAENIGVAKGTIPVEISTRFLEHFSEQLYSSPQKAFEELISNGWDAGADFVDIRLSRDLSSDTATMLILDNGVSMDEQGLRDLWRIAFSGKATQPKQHGRNVVGKFGIGKLATYVLATHLTYICKSEDGKIRRITMDYGVIDKNSNSDKLISQVKLDLFEVEENSLQDALKKLEFGEDILQAIENGVQPENIEESQNEFGGLEAKLERKSRDTWTLVILSNLKQTGRDLKVGILRRMLEAALPLSSEMIIRLNGEQIKSKKLSFPTIQEWELGPNLPIQEFEVEEDEPDEETGKLKTTTLKISRKSQPFNHIEIPEIGIITGQIKLYEDKISGGKSEERGSSNGFFINVLGRIVNQTDPSFGAENLSHAAWARFRMTVKTDGLNNFINTNREQFRDQRALKIFRSFLRKSFNLARSAYDSDANVELPDGGDVLVKSLGVVSLSPLRSAVSEVLRTKPPIPGLFDDSGIENREEKQETWKKSTADNIRNTLSKVKYEKSDDQSFVKYRISDSSIIINKDHPFVIEHTRTRAEKELMRTIAMVNLLTDVYALETGIDPQKLQSVREYRDQLMRFRAMQRRQSGTHIARLLLASQHNSSQSQQLEKVVGDALRYLGFTIQEIAGPGEPEGLAKAFSFSAPKTPTEEDPEPPLYKFTYDAKSSKHTSAKTGNISLDGINEHRIRYTAQYALVVAPGFEDGALSVRCKQLSITPIKASDLGRLLEYTAEFGAIPLDKLEDIFKIHDPDSVSEWVDELGTTLKKSRKFTIDLFLKALEQLKGRVPDALQASLISYTCRHVLGAATVVDKDVIALVKGLSILVPDLIGIDDKEQIIVNASPERVAAAVSAQLEKLHAETDDEQI